MREIIGGQIGYENLINKKFNFLKNKQIISNGRSALYFILKKIKEKIDIVYVPSYLCESILQPIKKIGIKYKFYKVDKEFNFKLPSKKNSAIIFLNYFGNNNKNYKNNNKKNIFYIKDCTHDVFSKLKNFNDFNKNDIFKFASLKKYIPFPVGAITNIDKVKLEILNKKDYLIFQKHFETLKIRGKYFSKPQKNIDIVLEKKMLKNQAKFNIFESKRIFKNKIPENIKNKIFKYDLNTILKKRNDNFIFLKKILNKKIKVISKNNCFPLNFTILLKKKEKNKIVKILNDHRIFPTTLWPLPKEINIRKYRYSHMLSSRLLSLPVDHRYNKKHIEFMVSIIHKALK